VIIVPYVDDRVNGLPATNTWNCVVPCSLPSVSIYPSNGAPRANSNVRTSLNKNSL